MVSKGDKVISAVSGGTDSLTTLQLLTEFSEHQDIDVVSLTIDEGIQGYRDESLEVIEKVTEELGVQQVTISFKEVFGKTLDELSEISKEKDGPDPCTLCGILRRELLNQASRELNGDKLAIGHNLDDITQTVLLNHLRGDISRFKRMRPKTEGKRYFVPRIKPLRQIKEKEVAIYSMLKDHDPHVDKCPHVGGMRSKVRDFLNEMEQEHPTTKFKIMRMNDKIRKNLEIDEEDFELKTCEICGEPTTQEKCRSCNLLEQLDIKRKEKTLISK